MISTHVTYRTRSAFRDVARVFGLSIPEINSLSKTLPYYSSGSVADAVESSPEASDFPLRAEPYRTIVSLASELIGRPRHLGVHLGGLVIADRPLTDYLPLEMASKGIVVSQYDMHPVEELGLVKMDLLGQRAISVVDETVRSVHDVLSETVDPYAFPPADPAASALVRRGRTIGGFQVESPGMRNLLRMMRAENKRDLLIGLSLIRPGPASSGMKEHYIRRRLGLEKPFYLHPSMETVLSETFGVMLYQEDILKVAKAVAGFDLAVGDELRKAISKSRSDDALAAVKKRFLAGAASRGLATPSASAVWEMVSQFAAYSYCKAHAATYAEISWATVCLKARYPAQFHAARINNRAGFYHPRVYLEEARRMGVSILPLDINESHYHFSTSRCSIRVGLSIVKNLSRRTVDKILVQSSSRPFSSLADFLSRVTLPVSQAEALILAGAFSSLGRNRPELLLDIDAFTRSGLSALEKTRSTRLPDYPLEKILACEDASLEMTPTAHPMTPFRPAAAARSARPARELPSSPGKVVTLAGFLVTRRRAPTKNGDMMEFATLEDETDIFEVTLFPAAYRRFAKLLRSAGPFLVKGKVEDQYGALTVTAAFLDYLLPSQHRTFHAPPTESPIPCDPDTLEPTLFTA